MAEVAVTQAANVRDFRRGARLLLLLFCGTDASVLPRSSCHGSTGNESLHQKAHQPGEEDHRKAGRNGLIANQEDSETHKRASKGRIDD